MSAPVNDERRTLLLKRGALVLVVMVVLAVTTMTAALVRNNETQQLNDENRRLNGCVRDLIVTIGERSEFTARLDTQDAKDRAATQTFWTEVAAAGPDRAKARAVFDEYQNASRTVEVERKAILAERDAHKFPSLAECQ